MSIAEVDIRWCQWCGKTLGPRQTDFCKDECANEFAADYRQQRASASALPAEGAASSEVACESSQTRPVESPGSTGSFRHNAPEWTEEETTALRRVLSDNVSASQAAETLSKEFRRPVTKNVVIGRCDRLGIALPRARKVWRPGEPTPNPFPQMIDEYGRAVPTLGCLWPIGHPNDPQFHFCGQKRRAPHKPYCPVHAAEAYTKVSADKADEILRPADFYRKAPPNKGVV